MQTNIQLDIATYAMIVEALHASHSHSRPSVLCVLFFLCFSELANQYILVRITCKQQLSICAYCGV